MAVGRSGPWETYGLAADIGMPNFRLKPHLRWFERVVIGDLDVDGKSAPDIWRVWGAGDGTLEVLQVAAVDGHRINTRLFPVCLNVQKLFGDAPISAASHDGEMVQVGEWPTLGNYR